MGKTAYLNGRLVPSEEACVSVLDRGFLYGDGLFETMRTYNGTPFLVGTHIDRLLWGAAKIGLELKVSKDELKKAVYDTVKANGFGDAVIRLTVTRGIAAERLKVSPDMKPTIVITCDELKDIAASHYDRGVDVISVTDTRSDLALIKSLNYLPNALAKHEADKKGAFEAVFVTKKGFVTEGATSNVFAVLDGILITPPLVEKVLPGITREVVKTLATKEDIRFNEDAIIVDEIKDAEEVFITNQMIEIVPVRSFDGDAIGNDCPGHITDRISNAYRRFIRERSS
jgi:D-amino acid aminotransferase